MSGADFVIYTCRFFTTRIALHRFATEGFCEDEGKSGTYLVENCTLGVCRVDCVVVSVLFSCA